MAYTIVFDSLAYMQMLQDAGISQEKAQALAKAQKKAFEDVFASKDPATKADIALLKKDISQLEISLKAQMADMEVRQTRALYNALIGFAAVIAAVVIGSISIAVLFIKS